MRSSLLIVAISALLLQDAASEGRRWWRHVEFLASDELAGRDVGSPGFDQAAAYVERQFREIGLKPGGVDGYRQPVRLEKRTLLPDQSALSVSRDGEERPLVLGQDATLTPRGELDGNVEAPMVFAGYGLSLPGTDWNELRGLDLRGKVVVYVAAPAPVAIPDNVRSHVASTAERWAVLKSAGAIGVAAIGNLQPVPAAERGGRGSGAGAPRSPAGPPSMTVLEDPDLRDTAGLALSVILTRSGLEKLLEGSGHAAAELAQLVADRQPLPTFPLAGTLRARVALQREPLRSSNVIGIYEGADPALAWEYVVMSAHLDHVGVGREIDGDRIYNGAMDDASGVASVIEIARMMKASATRPGRSVLFMAQTAEEKGLLGSRYFVAHPTVAFDDIVADINLDMFLPLYPLKVIEVQGLAESSLGVAVRAAASALGVDVQTDRQPEENRFIRSDQYSFIRRGIPALAFKFGYEFGSPEEAARLAWVRDVYHRPNDDLRQPVNLEAAATFNRVILGLLQRVANDKARPTWNEDSFFKRFAAPRQ